jgi:DNA mismatch repair protein MutS2
LDPAVIDAARARMTTVERDVAQFLAELHQKMNALEKERATIGEREQAVEARERSLEQTWERKYAGKITEVERRAAELSAQFERRAKDTIDELSQKARAKIAKTSREFHESVESIAPRKAPEPSRAAAAEPALKIAEGARVRLKNIRQPATVRRVLANGLIEVDAGFLKMQVSASDVEEVLPPADKPGRVRSMGFQQTSDLGTSYQEINLIGQRAEEACDQVEKFLDTATLAQVERVRIVHGHGMGILKRAVADLLKQSPHVAKFYPAPPEQGGSGATIAELKPE